VHARLAGLVEHGRRTSQQQSQLVRPEPAQVALHQPEALPTEQSAQVGPLGRRITVGPEGIDADPLVGRR
jgi:hypothetical protein